MIEYRNPTRALLEFNRDIVQNLLHICNPLFNNFGFTSFGYTRIREDGSRVILETNQNWLERYSENTFQEQNDGSHSLVHNINQTISNCRQQELYVNLLNGKPKSKLHEYLFSLDVWNSVSIYVHMNKFIEVFHLGTTRENEKIMDLLFNKKVLLKRFIHYFRSKIQDLNIEKAPYIVDANLCSIFSKPSNIEEDERIESFLNETAVDKFYLKTHDKFITKREAECLHYLALGKSSKEIGRVIQISPRTVEAYIALLKNKVNVFTTSDLIDIAHENYLNSRHCFLTNTKDQYE